MLFFVLSTLTAYAVPWYEWTYTPVGTNTSHADNIASSSITHFDYSVNPFSINDAVENTVAYSRIYAHFGYYDMSNNPKAISVHPDSNGHINITRPSDYASARYFYFSISKTGIPSPGKYKLTVDFQSNVHNSWGSLLSNIVRQNNNATTQVSKLDGFTFSKHESGAFSISGILQIGTVTYIDAGVWCSSVSFPINGSVFVNFTRVSSNTSADASSPDADSSEQDTQNNIANSTQQAAENTNLIVQAVDAIGSGVQAIIQGIVDVVQTISHQLEAFWNQLAGEFTNLYNKMNQQHSEQMENDNDNTSAIVSGADDNASDIMANADVNTDKTTQAIEDNGNFIVNGIKNLFLPPDDYWSGLFNRLNTFFSERFGFLYFPVEVIVKVLNMILTADTGSPSIPFPEVKFMDVTIISAQNVDLSWLTQGEFAALIEMLHFFVEFLLVIWLVNLFKTKIDNIMHR